MITKEKHPYTNLFWISLAIITLFRFWFCGQLLLTGDEAYHWEWSRHLAWGYYDHPPMVAFIMRLFTGIFGHSLRAVRAQAVIFSGLSVIIVYLLAKDISGENITCSRTFAHSLKPAPSPVGDSSPGKLNAKGGYCRSKPHVNADKTGNSYTIEKSGLLAGLLALIIPIYTAGSLITTTDTPHAFFWLLSVYCFYKSLFTDNRNWWYAAGVSLGLAFLSKFFAFFIPIGLLGFLILSPQKRHWLKKKEPYLAILLALAIFSPFIWWNANNNWVTFGFNLTKRHKTPQLTLKFFIEYLGGQSLVLFPAFLVLYIYGLYVSAKRGLKQGNDTYLYLFCTTAPLWLLFLGISTYQRIGIHWPISTYFSGLVIMALLLPESPKWYKTLFKAGVWGSLIMTLTAYILVLVLSITPKIIPWGWAYPGRPEKINAKALRELYGWEEIGQRISKSYKEMSKQRETFIFTGSYALSSQLSFYTPGNPFVKMLGTGSVHGRNYDFWQDLSLLKGQNALQISKDGKHPQDYHKFFERVEAEKPLGIYIDGELIRTFTLFRCYNYLGG